MVLYEKISIISPPANSSLNIIVNPSDAWYSLEFSKTPFTKISRKSILYDVIICVWLDTPTVLNPVLKVGKDAQVTPAPVDLTYCPSSPIVSPIEIASTDNSETDNDPTPTYCVISVPPILTDPSTLTEPPIPMVCCWEYVVPIPTWPRILSTCSFSV